MALQGKVCGMVSATGRCRLVPDKNKQHAKHASNHLCRIYAAAKMELITVCDKTPPSAATIVNNRNHIRDIFRRIVHYSEMINQLSIKFSPFGG
jgi:hypothetical protein